MDEACDDFLAGARLASNQHGRVGRGDLRRLAQHVTPFDGLADDPQVGGRLQTVDASLHAGVDPLRAILVHLRRDLGDLAATDSEAEVVRDPASERHVRAIERQRPLRPERNADHRLRRAGRHAESRTVAGADQPLRPVRGGCAHGFAPQVVDDQFVAFGHRHVGHIAGRRVHDHLPSLIEARHAQRIVGQHLARDRRQPRQRGVEIDRHGELAQQFQRAVEICTTKVQMVGSAVVDS